LNIRRARDDGGRTAIGVDSPMAATLPVVAIGASGSAGIGDLRRFLGALPRDIAAAVLVVLHRPVDRISHLRELLAQSTALPVVIAADFAGLEAGTCYIGEPDQHLTLLKKRLAGLVPAQGNRYRNRTIDLLFESVALHAGTKAIGVVLSGMSDDGSRGLAAINHHGGRVMVVDPSGHGMPENAIAYNGLIDLIGTPEQIAGAITTSLHTSLHH
jgi:two-component system, chemotaxis family, protein-glutamate methylesterase/glutaminase